MHAVTESNFEMKAYTVTAVAVWWIANIIASLSSKNVMEDNNVTTNGSKSWTPALEDLRWIELTFIQHLIGGIASIVWLKLVMRKPVWDPTFVEHPNPI